MSERYKILDAIMANPDPMIRQRLEMAYDAGRVSVLHEKNVFADDKDFNCAVTFQTAFTNRDNATLTARVAELEQENAKLLDEVTARRFTDDLPLKDRIKELDAELLADGVTMITHPPTAPPAESVEDAKAFKRVAIELRIRFPVEIQYNSEFEAMVKRLEGGSL